MLKTLRPLIKGLTWRFFAAFDTALVTAVVMFVKTGTIGLEVLAVVVGIVGMELFTKTGLYALHEMVWEKTPFLAKHFG